jgi:hypothetical protein
MVDSCTRDYGFAACKEGSKLLIKHFLRQITVQNCLATPLGCVKVGFCGLCRIMRADRLHNLMAKNFLVPKFYG